MASPKNRNALIAAGAIILLLMVCGSCAITFYNWWNLPVTPDPQPTSAISIQNVAKLERLKDLSQKAGIVSLAWSPDSRRLAAAGTLGDYELGKVTNPETHKLWDVTTGRELQSFSGQPDVMTSVAFSPDGQRLISTSKNAITIWNAADGSKLQTIDTPQKTIGNIAFSSDGQTIVVAASNTIEFWQVATGRKLRTLEGYSGLLSGADGKFLGWNQKRDGRQVSFQLSDLDSGQDLWTLDSNYGTPVTLSHDGKTIAWKTPWMGEILTAGLVLRDSTNGGEIRDLGTIRSYSCAAFSSDDSLLAVVEPQFGFIATKLILWDAEREKICPQQ